MNGRLFLMAFAIVVGSTAPGWSQVVQLPTFQQFGVSTTVMVPDGGSMSIGGLRSARESEITRGFGPLRNRAHGREVASSGVGVSARIHDLHEMDEDILRMAGSELSPAEAVTLEKAGRLTRGVARSSGKGPKSLAELRRERARSQDAERQQALVTMQQGDQFRDEGKLTTAKTLYRRAWKQTSDEQVRRDLRERLVQLDKNASAR